MEISMLAVGIALGMGPTIASGLQALVDHKMGRAMRLGHDLPESVPAS